MPIKTTQNRKNGIKMKRRTISMVTLQLSQTAEKQSKQSTEDQTTRNGPSSSEDYVYRSLSKLCN